ncbi:putative ATP-dependent DNA helicase PcrA [Blattamonas nauphoetae]|uniref:DNA 3'-5' helicase n=1 Tax=Blattamonas nauphoetae TaxID=2049346 RepID=A0ABQ9XRR6_9EUKA|nr:putative ATP-dependent DNA helicase PcrA [Blattamonas nauphoetae]
MHLDVWQRAAVMQDPSTPLIIFAGAGSGKTTTMCCRIAYLLSFSDPSKILAITFTSRAAKHLKTQLNSLFSTPIHSIQVKTFHSFSLSIILRHLDTLNFNPNTFGVIDKARQLSIVKECLAIWRAQAHSANSEVNQTFLEDPDLLLRFLLRMKTKQASKQTNPPNRRQLETEIEAFALDFYNKRLRQESLIDFVDMVALAVELLRDHPDIRESVRSGISHVLVDEYQDTSTLQFELLTLITTGSKLFDNTSNSSLSQTSDGKRATEDVVSPSRSFLSQPSQIPEPCSLTVVGDDDQSIYSFRGASSTVFTIFPNFFPSPRTSTLSINYRSTNVIVQVARSLIDTNTRRTPKDLRASDSNNFGRLVPIYLLPNELSEVSFVTNQIRMLLLAGVPPDDIAILSRVGKRVLRPFLLRLKQLGIPTVSDGNKRRNVEQQDMIAYLRLVCNENDDSAFLRVVNMPKREIGEKALVYLVEWAKELDLGLVRMSQLLIDLKFPAMDEKSVEVLGAEMEKRGWRRGEIEKEKRQLENTPKSTFTPQTPQKSLFSPQQPLATPSHTNRINLHPHPVNPHQSQHSPPPFSPITKTKRDIEMTTPSGKIIRIEHDDSESEDNIVLVAKQPTHRTNFEDLEEFDDSDLEAFSAHEEDSLTSAHTRQSKQPSPLPSPSSRQVDSRRQLKLKPAGRAFSKSSQTGLVSFLSIISQTRHFAKTHLPSETLMFLSSLCLYGEAAEKRRDLKRNAKEWRNRREESEENGKGKEERWREDEGEEESEDGSVWECIDQLKQRFVEMEEAAMDELGMSKSNTQSKLDEPQESSANPKIDLNMTKNDTIVKFRKEDVRKVVQTRPIISQHSNVTSLPSHSSNSHPQKQTGHQTQPVSRPVLSNHPHQSSLQTNSLQSESQQTQSHSSSSSLPLSPPPADTQTALSSFSYLPLLQLILSEDSLSSLDPPFSPPSRSDEIPASSRPSPPIPTSSQPSSLSHPFSTPSIKRTQQPSFISTTLPTTPLPSSHSSSRVTVTTIHQSKGLEWKHVFLVRWNEGTLPVGRVGKPTLSEIDENVEEINKTQPNRFQSDFEEEEKRIAYVGLSRATSHLSLSLVATQKPSPFLFSLPPLFLRLVDLTDGSGSGGFDHFEMADSFYGDLIRQNWDFLENGLNSMEGGSEKERMGDIVSVNGVTHVKSTKNEIISPTIAPLPFRIHTTLPQVVSLSDLSIGGRRSGRVIGGQRDWHERREMENGRREERHSLRTQSHAFEADPLTTPSITPASSQRMESTPQPSYLPSFTSSASFMSPTQEGKRSFGGQSVNRPVLSSSRASGDNIAGTDQPKTIFGVLGELRMRIARNEKR